MKNNKYSAPIIVVAVLFVVGITVGFATSNASVRDDNSQKNTEVSASTSNNTFSQEVNNQTNENLNNEIASKSVSDNSEIAYSISELEWVWPCEGCFTVSSVYGNRLHPVYGEYIFSDHITIDGVEGALVYVALNGTVAEVGVDDQQGNYIVVTHNNDIKTVYRHLDTFEVSEGDSVTAGDTIGIVGSTGDVTDICLSFCVYVDGTAVDPMLYISR